MLEWARYRLRFAFEAVTSRSRMWHKDTYLVRDTAVDGSVRLGECALFAGLSADERPDYEQLLSEACRRRDPYYGGCSSITMGLETALGLKKSNTRWNHGDVVIPINGLVWMGTPELMLSRIDDKIRQGYRCIKLKINASGLEEELRLLRHIRDAFPAGQLEIRLDANGAFTPETALMALDRLARYDIHSIEQPIHAGQRREMRHICQESPIPVALDEELIGFWTESEQRRLLDDVLPQYIILKPTLCGGFDVSDRWISLAEERGIGWWATSALESDIGLDAIASWVATYDTQMPQGLGTGQLFTNNIPSPLRLLPGQGITRSADDSFTLPDTLQWHS